MTFKTLSFSIVFSALTAIALSSCHSSKHAADNTVNPTSATTVAGTPSASSYDISTLTNDSNFTSRIHATMTFNGQSLSTSGHLRMRRGDVIQVSLLDPIIGITEVGRLEISPDMVLLIDRYNKRYVLMTYDEINALSRQQLSYPQVEYLFWQQALQAGKDEVKFQIPTSKPIALSLRLSKRGNDAKWDAHTTPSERYTQVSAEELMKGINEINN